MAMIYILFYNISTGMFHISGKLIQAKLFLINSLTSITLPLKKRINCESEKQLITKYQITECLR